MPRKRGPVGVLSPRAWLIVWLAWEWQRLRARGVTNGARVADARPRPPLAHSQTFHAMNSAADSLRLFLLSAPFAKTIRHLLNTGAGALAAWGIETGNSAALIGTLAAFLITSFWSWLAKRGFASTPGGDGCEIKTLCGILASAAVSAIAGVLAEQGFNAEKPEELLQGLATLFFGGNLALSKLMRPDIESQALKQMQKEFNGASMLAASLLALLLIPSCSITREQWEDAGERAGLQVADVGLSLAVLQIQNARRELDGITNAKPSELFAKRAALILAERALMKAQRAVQRKSARRESKTEAKQPRDVEPDNAAALPPCFFNRPNEGSAPPQWRDAINGGSSARRAPALPLYGSAVAAHLRQ